MLTVICLGKRYSEYSRNVLLMPLLSQATLSLAQYFLPRTLSSHPIFPRHSFETSVNCSFHSSQSIPPVPGKLSCQDYSQ